MSLISLTFGKGKQEPSFNQIEIASPCDSISISPDVENLVEVKKACTFFKHTGIYIVGEVLSGAVKGEMQGECNGKRFCIEEIDSRLGNAAKEGMSVGLSTSGISLEDLKAGDVISLSPSE